MQTKKRRQRYSKEERARLLAEYEETGGKDAVAFAEGRGVRAATFQSWLSRSRAKGRGQKPRTKSEVRMVRVEGPSPEPSGWPRSPSAVELEWAKVRVVLPVSAGPEYIAAMVIALTRESPC
jgi:transposase-like protein